MSVFHSGSFLLHAHTLSSFSLVVGPPRESLLGAPAVPLLWLEFVLLCFGVARTKAAWLQIVLVFSPCSFPRGGMAFVSIAGVSEAEKGLLRLGSPLSGGGRLFRTGSPPVAGPDPHESAGRSWAKEPLWMNAFTLCVAVYTQSPGCAAVQYSSKLGIKICYSKWGTWTSPRLNEKVYCRNTVHEDLRIIISQNGYVNQNNEVYKVIQKMLPFFKRHFTSYDSKRLFETVWKWFHSVARLCCFLEDNLNDV